MYGTNSQYTYQNTAQLALKNKNNTKRMPSQCMFFNENNGQETHLIIVQPPKGCKGIYDSNGQYNTVELLRAHKDT